MSPACRGAAAAAVADKDESCPPILLTVRVHPRAEGVEDPGNADLDLVLPVEVEEEGLGHALAFVVASSHACAARNTRRGGGIATSSSHRDECLQKRGVSYISPKKKGDKCCATIGSGAGPKVSGAYRGS